MLHVGGRTSTFRNGFCMTTGGEALDLSLGTLVLGVRGNADLPYLHLIVVSTHIASLTDARLGGRQLLGMRTCWR